MQLRVFNGPIYFKDNLRTIEAQFPKKLRTTEAHFEFTGPYKKKECRVEVWLLKLRQRYHRIHKLSRFNEGNLSPSQRQAEQRGNKWSRIPYTMCRSQFHTLRRSLCRWDREDSCSPIPGAHLHRQQQSRQIQIRHAAACPRK